MTMSDQGGGFAPPPRHLQYRSGRQKVILILLVVALVAGCAAAAYYFVDQKEASVPKRTEYHSTKGRDWVPPPEKPVPVPATVRPPAPATPKTAVMNGVAPRPQGNGLGEDKILKSKISIQNQDGGGSSYLRDQKPTAPPKSDDPEAQAEGEDNALSKSLARSNLGPKSKARVDEHYLYTISAGRHIPCNRLTAINSQLPGFVSCKTPQAIWNDDNSAILLPAGTDFFGEIKSSVIVGNDRVPILWREIRTPDRPPIKIAINSPGADELGRAGATGAVNNHIVETLLATLTYTLIEALPNVAIAALQNNNSNSQNSINYNQFATPSQNLGGTVLRQYMNRAPTLEANPGEHVMIFVGSDIDLYPALGFRTARGFAR